MRLANTPYSPNRLTALSVALLIFGASHLNSSWAADEFVLKGVNLVHVETGSVDPDQSVRVEGGQIVEVSQSDADQAVTVIDASGAFIVPALWDMHVHLTDAKEIVLPVLVANGVLGVRDMGGAAVCLLSWVPRLVMEDLPVSGRTGCGIWTFLSRLVWHRHGPGRQ